MSADTEEMRLSSHDRQSAVWVKLRKHMEAKLQALRIKNDLDLDQVATAKVRGQIQALKMLLNLEAQQNNESFTESDDLPD